MKIKKTKYVHKDFIQNHLSGMTIAQRAWCSPRKGRNMSNLAFATVLTKLQQDDLP